MVSRLLILLLFVLLPARALADEVVRIAVLDGAKHVEVAAKGLRLRLLDGESGYVPVSAEHLTIAARAGRLEVQGRVVGAEALKLRADAPLLVAGKQLRGALEVLASEKGLVVVNELPMEAYLAAVLGSEMPPSFPPEALKAQAVAARTYALGKKLAAQDLPYHLGATVLSQVYGGVNREDPRTKAAVKATRGQVLVHEHAPIEAYFFSSCGGTTAEGAEALGRPLPYLTSHACPESPRTPGAHWSLRLTRAEVGKKLGLRDVRALRVTSRTRTGRARLVEVETAKGRRRLTAVDLRAKLGYGALKSLQFEVERAGERLIFEGKGSGHGAGLCQWGARAAADQGWDFARILAHYYPQTELRRMY